MFIGLATEITTNVLIIAMFIALLRLIKGPYLADRVVALDLISTHVVGILAIYSIQTHEPVLLQAAFVLALLSFAGTVAYSVYLERRGRP